MSHTTLVNSVLIKSESALQKAAIYLRSKGIDVELVKNAVPRMYYPDQIRKMIRNGQKATLQYHSNVEECDYVLKVNQSYYDIGLIKDVNGNFIPLYDNFQHPSPYSNLAENIGKQPLDQVLGAVNKAEKSEIGKFLQAYSLCAAVESCEEAGYTITSSIINSKGEAVIEVEVV